MCSSDCAMGSSTTANVISHKAAISVHAECDQGGHCKIGSSTTANVISHNAAISLQDACDKRGQCEQALTVISHSAVMPPEGSVHVVSHSAAISAIEKGMPYGMRAGFSTPANVISHNAAISLQAACGQGGQCEQAENAAISACEVRSQRQQALLDLRKAGMFGNVISNNAANSACE